MSDVLDDVQVEAFHDAGFVVLERVFASDALDALRAEADRVLALVLNSSLALRRRSPRLDAVVRSPPSAINVRKVQPVNDLSPLLASVSSDERLIAPMRQLMDDEPVLMEEKLNYKQEVDVDGADFSFITRTFPEEFPLHHDWGYYRAQGYPVNTISSAVALDDCQDRGPIRVVSGSHRQDPPLLNPDLDGEGIIAPGFFGDDRCTIDAPAGSVMLFHAKLAHDSEPNRSGLPRRLMIYSHYPRSHDPDAEPDRRNGPLRAYSIDFEDRYRALRDAGTHTDAAIASA